MLAFGIQYSVLKLNQLKPFVNSPILYCTGAATAVLVTLVESQFKKKNVLFPGKSYHNWVRNPIPYNI